MEESSGFLLRKHLSLRGYMVYDYSADRTKTHLPLVDPKCKNSWGRLLVEDVPLLKDPPPYGSVIARMRGLDVQSNQDAYGNWLINHTIVFEADHQYKGSTLEVRGQLPQKSDWTQMAIVGGTGQFTLAQGVVYGRMISSGESQRDVIELRITAYYTPLPLSPPPS